MSAYRPVFNPTTLPESERANAEHLTTLAMFLQIHLHAFASALYLLDHCDAILKERLDQSPSPIFDPQKDHQSWALIAAKAAAMEVYHFGTSISSIRSLAGRITSLQEHYDHVALKRLERLFQSQFLGWDKMRHGISHVADSVATPAWFHRNYNNPETRGWWISGMSDRTYSVSHEGTIYSVEISEATLMRLADISDRVLDTLRPMADATYPPA